MNVSCEKPHLHQTIDQLSLVLAGAATVRFDDRDECLDARDAVEVSAGLTEWILE